MNKQLKFRVWNKTYCEMFYPEKLLKNGDYVEKFYITLDGKLRGDFKHCGDVDCLDDYVIMQYTGFLDKNGNKIYENDIIECPNGKSKDENIIMEVEYPFITKRSDTVKIIGNIFEIPLKLQR